jgi:hypothetical protein
MPKVCARAAWGYELMTKVVPVGASMASAPKKEMAFDLPII